MTDTPQRDERAEDEALLKHLEGETPIVVFRDGMADVLRGLLAELTLLRQELAELKERNRDAAAEAAFNDR